MSIGEKLRSLRLKMKRTLREQSETFGVSLNSVYRWEHDLAAPRKTVLKKMADFYGVPFNWLIDSSAADDEYVGAALYPESNLEQQLLRTFQKLSENKKHQVLGYIERMYMEELDFQG